MKRFQYIFIFAVFAMSANAQICPGESGKLTWEGYFNIFDDEISQVTALYDYPYRPNVTKTIYKTQSPLNYGNYMGARYRGYLNVPQSTTVTFNVTGDDQTRFYLSTDASPENKVLQCYVPDWSSVEDHTKYPEQTSGQVTLDPGIDYYFDVIYAEGSGGDHASVYWKTDLVDELQWNIISAGFLKAVDCVDPVCPEPGTPCDDGDASTSNDIEDGFCHCKGSPSTLNSCVGDRGELEAYRFENIPSNDISELYMSPNFPGNPDYGYKLDQFTRPYSSNIDNFGEQVQAFLSVPVSGNYKFNVTGNDNTVLFLSSNDDPANKQAHQALVSNNSGMTEHDKYIWQSTGNIYLDANQYYYIELNFKAGTGGEHYSIFWQTPFTDEGVWKRVPTVHFFDYSCEVACIAQGTVCDDGDPFTNNDLYDENCECAGTPCSGPDCDSPLANYVPYDKCSVTDQLDNNPSNNWLSCTPLSSPNPLRPESHWIMYDLGARHELHQSQIWNYNVAGETDKGFQMVSVDYSEDGVNWNEFGTYSWSLAPGDSGYSGFSGPHFQGLYAQYILITSLDGTSTCKGLGKVAFTAVMCPLEGTSCDDENIYTVDDKFDSNCQCVGQSLEENECENEVLTLGDSTIYTNVYSAQTYVNALSQIADENVVSIVGGASVLLEPGFETGDNTLFIAAIDTCEIEEARIAQTLSRQDQIDEKARQRVEDKMMIFQVIQDESSEDVLIKFYISKPGRVQLKIKDTSGNTAFDLLDHDFANIGLFTKNINTRRFKSGTYAVELMQKENIESKVLNVR